jgi:hypothetical protein
MSLFAAVGPVALVTIASVIVVLVLLIFKASALKQAAIEISSLAQTGVSAAQVIFNDISLRITPLLYSAENAAKGIVSAAISGTTNGVRGIVTLANSLLVATIDVVNAGLTAVLGLLQQLIGSLFELVTIWTGTLGNEITIICSGVSILCTTLQYLLIPVGYVINIFVALIHLF